MGVWKIVKTVIFAGAFALSGCATAGTGPALADLLATPVTARSDNFEKDRASILAMAGDYKVTFDFTETVSFVEGYELKAPKRSGGYEVVRVIEDRGDFISLQHILVVGGEQKFAVKHWRQDWQYEPSRILTFIGGNAWAWRDVPESERAGKWSQTVYQVDDAPRYSAVAAWTYEDGLAEWTPPHEWRPLPRREQTTRDDYHAINAMNRHVITPWGWVHEQDNDKLMLDGERKVLAREIGVNTYRRDSRFDVGVATDYWSRTEGFWKLVRAEWDRIAKTNPAFSIILYGETEELYLPLLETADKFAAGELTIAAADAEAKKLIAKFISTKPLPLSDRLSLPRDPLSE